MLILQKPEDTSNRFFRIPTWLAFVFVIDFPPEHWYANKIRECFSGFAEVAEIDPVCLSGDNFGPLRLLLEVNDRLEIPSELGVGRAGSVVKILPIRVWWPRQFQLDAQGNLASFFGPPPPPEAGPSLGPPGPFNRAQQTRPQPHHFNQMYPPSLPPSDYLGSPNSSVSAPSAPLFLGLALAFARALTLPSAPSSSPSSGRPSSSTTSSESLSGVSASLTLAPPPSLRSTPSPQPQLITYRRTRLRKRPLLAAAAAAVPAAAAAAAATLAAAAAPVPAAAPSPPAAQKRHSSRLAAKAPATFVDMTTQAVQRKALLNSLSGCSAKLRKHVSKRNILTRNNLPFEVGELRKLVSAARFGCKDVDVVDAVTTGQE